MSLTLSCGCEKHSGGRKPCPELRRLQDIVKHSKPGEANLAALRRARLHMSEGQ